MPRKQDCPRKDQDSDQPRVKRQKLTVSQLERKRELDREAQRTIRERTKNHIAHLEALVQQLQGDEGSQVEKLVAQLNESRAEVSRLKDALNSIIKISAAATGTPLAALQILNAEGMRVEDTKEEHAHTAEETKPQRTSGSFVPTVEVQPDIFPPISNAIQHRPPTEKASGSHGISSPHPMVDLNSYSVFETNLVTKTTRVENHADGDESGGAIIDTTHNKQLSISQMADSILSNNKLEGRHWYLAGVLLSHILKTQHEDGSVISFIHDEDIPIRAVFEGWGAVMARYPLDRGWQWLKELDEKIYFNFFGPAERLMHLRNCRYQFLHQLYPDAGWNNNLPAFFAARPSQQYLEHDPLVEHFPWPSFRERLLFAPREFATDKFMDALRKNVQFIWNYDSKDLYQKDPFTGLYLYSDLFTKHLMDIKCYTVKPKFFENFPHLRSDIPWNNDPSPFSLISHRFSVASSSTTNSSTKPSPTHSDHEEGALPMPDLDSGYQDSQIWPIGWESPISPSYIEELRSA